MPSLKQPYEAVPSDDGGETPLRQHVDDPSSSDDGDDLDPASSLRPRHAPIKAGATTPHGGARPLRGSRRPQQQLCCGLSLSNPCLILALLFGTAAVIFLGGGGLYMYNTAPKDGLSPPWYPTPRGGTVQSWRRSYDKAKQIVERMTLVEKVNVTTGTG
jgi:beta-glucosidase